MTAIINFQVDQQPVVFSDLLLSARDLVQVPALPSLTDAVTISNSTAGAWRPAGLCQKIALIHPDLIVSWSGFRSAAEAAIEELRRRCASGAPSPEELERFFSSLDRSGNELCLIAMLMVEPTRIFHVGYNAYHFRDARFGDVRLGGSGHAAVAELLTSVQSFHENQGRTLTPFAKAVGCALTMNGNLLAREIVVGDTLSQLFGGGYEFATRSGRNWARLPDVLTLIWVARETDENRFEIPAFPIRILHQSYDGDLMVIRTLKIEPDQPIADERFVIPPVGRVVTDRERREAPMLPFSARWMCHQFVVQRRSGIVRPISRVTYTENVADRPVRVSWDGQTLDVIVPPGYFEILGDLAADST